MAKKQSPLRTFPEDSPGWASIAASLGERDIKDIAVYMHKELTNGLWELRFRVPLENPNKQHNLRGWNKDELGKRLMRLGHELIMLNQEEIDESEELEFGF